MDVLAKLEILTDAAKYDAACTSSGVPRGFRQGYIGNTTSSIAGCCHTFSADGRCVTLLKVLMSNCCVYDCAYCVNRRSNDTRRAAFTPQELADLTINFYRPHSSGRIPLQRLHPRQGHPRRRPGAGGAAGPFGRPTELQHRAALRDRTADSGPGKDEGRCTGSYAADPSQKYSK